MKGEDKRRKDEHKLSCSGAGASVVTDCVRTDQVTEEGQKLSRRYQAKLPCPFGKTGSTAQGKECVPSHHIGSSLSVLARLVVEKYIYVLL